MYFQLAFNTLRYDTKIVELPPSFASLMFFQMLIGFSSKHQFSPRSKFRFVNAILRDEKCLIIIFILRLFFFSKMPIIGLLSFQLKFDSHKEKR